MSKERKNKIFRWVIYIIFFIGLFMLQSSLNIFPVIAGVRPVLFIPAVICVGMFEGELMGAVLGVVAGCLWDLVSTNAFGIGALFLMIAGWATAVLVIYLIRKNIFSAILICACALVFYSVLDWITTYVVLQNGDEWSMLFQFYLPLVIYSLFMVVPLYFLARVMAAKLQYKDEA